MEYISLGIFVIVALRGVLWGMEQRARLFQLPFLFGLGSLAFVVPQLIIYLVSKQHHTTLDVSGYLLWSSACVLCAYWGYAKKVELKKVRYLIRLGGANMVLSGLACLVVACFSVVLSHHLTYGPGGAGRITGGFMALIYMLVKLAMPLFILSLCLVNLRVKNAWFKFFAILSGVIIAYFIIVLGRRQWLFVAMYAAVFPLLLTGRLRVNKISRWLLTILVVLIIPVVIILLPAYRDQFMDPNLSVSDVIEREPPAKVIGEYLSGEQNLEIEQSVLEFKLAVQHGSIRWGAGIWNGCVWHYVPAFLVGSQMKQSLLLNDGRAALYSSPLQHDVEYLSYISKSGFADSFSEFGPFGLLLYYFMGRLYRKETDSWLLAKNIKSYVFIVMFGFYPLLFIYGSWSTFLTLALLPYLVYLFFCKMVLKAKSFKPSR
ncbi:hypothetical protein ACFPK9_08605 [Rubritalea spongiae]|uniref:Oligosaccharide repeat unit polymerase n=1 Tax=Rubritalea spongiae TaxID=430797 RepID=A0ABW5E2A0_9BACT